MVGYLPSTRNAKTALSFKFFTLQYAQEYITLMLTNIVIYKPSKIILLHVIRIMMMHFSAIIIVTVLVAEHR